MRILCILPYYFDVKHAANACMIQLAEHLKQNGEIVDILAINSNIGNKSVKNNSTSENSFKVYSVDNYFSFFCKKHYKILKNKNFENLPKLTKKFIWYFSGLRLRTIYHTDNRSMDLINAKTVLKSIGHNYDAIISNSYPFATHLLAMKLKKAGVAKKWYPILWDPFVYDNTFNQSKRSVNNRKKTACKILATADKIFMLEGIIKENIKLGYEPEYHKKTVEISLPTLMEYPKKVASIETYSLVFAGAFYSDIRNPEKMLEVLSNLPKDFSIKLYGKGCRDVITKMIPEFNSCNIVDFGLVSHEESLLAQNSADFLINLGNTATNQLPSKVFEYISMGKPVINFYFDKNDPGLFFFEKYPLCFNFYLNDYNEKDIENLIKFCYDNSLKQLSFDEATKNLKEYRKESICKKFYDNIR